MFRPDFQFGKAFMIRKISKKKLIDFKKIKQFSMLTIRSYSHTISAAGKDRKLAMPTRLSTVGTVFYSQLYIAYAPLERTPHSLNCGVQPLPFAPNPNSAYYRSQWITRNLAGARVGKGFGLFWINTKGSLYSTYLCILLSTEDSRPLR